MEKFLITGASQTKAMSQKELQKRSRNKTVSEIYDTANLLEIDFTNKKIIKKLSLKREKFDYSVDGYATNFTVPHLDGNYIYTPSHSTIYKVDIRSFEIENKISLKSFNDLHHIVILKDDLWAVSTGIDSIVRYNLRHEDCEVYNTCDKANQIQFDHNKDYRIINTKPHKYHPNFFNYIDGKMWVTRANQHDFFCLNSFEKIQLSDVAVHDGLFLNKLLYFTAVKGQIIIVDFYKKKVVEKIDIKINGRSVPGWCRGIHVTDNYFFVGFSTPRITTISKNIDWLKAKYKNKIPSLNTMIFKISRPEGKVVDQFEFDPSQLNAIFSITKKPVK